MRWDCCAPPSDICSWTRWTAIPAKAILDLPVQRTATFRGRRKIDMVFTPMLKGHFWIEAAFLDSDQQYLHVPRMRCGDMDPITWARIRWPEGQRDTAYMVCYAC